MAQNNYSDPQQLVQALNMARETLWQCLDDLDEETEIYPEWTKREIFAHIAGWEAMAFEIIYRHLHGYPTKDYAYTGVEDANARFVAVRQTTTVNNVKLECEINRFAILKLLDEIASFDEVITFPWGGDTITEFIEGAIQHEHDHATDIQNFGS